ncbi:Ubiquitin carboxyl-terminal hydrolase isozyme L3 [Balamuthia mandrillaris]
MQHSKADDEDEKLNDGTEKTNTKKGGAATSSSSSSSSPSIRERMRPSPSWLELESSPECFNKFLTAVEPRVARRWSFCDVFGFEEELLKHVPRPVAALILLFPFSQVNYQRAKATQKEMKQQRKKERKKKQTANEDGEPENNHQGQEAKKQKKDQSDGTLSEEPYFLNQRIEGCCGAIAVIHTIANCLLNDAGEDSIASSFVGESKDKDSIERGKLFVQNKRLRDANNNIILDGLRPSQETTDRLKGWLMVKSDLTVLKQLKWKRRWVELDGHKLFVSKTQRERGMNEREEKEGKKQKKKEKENGEEKEENKLKTEKQDKENITNEEGDQMIAKEKDDEKEEEKKKRKHIKKEKAKETDGDWMCFDLSKVTVLRGKRKKNAKTSPFLFHIRTMSALYTFKPGDGSSTSSLLEQRKLWGDGMMASREYWQMYFQANPPKAKPLRRRTESTNTKGKQRSKEQNQKPKHKGNKKNSTPKKKEKLIKPMKLAFNKASNHYVCLLPIWDNKTNQLRVGELDGFRSAPVFHRPTSSSTFLEDGVAVVQEVFIAQGNKAVEFNIIALAAAPKHNHNKNETQDQESEDRSSA